MLSAVPFATSQTVIPLYTKAVPNSIPGPDREKSSDGKGGHSVSKVSKPTLSVFLPASPKSVTAAVIICPGGGYSHLAFDKEGTNPAKGFQAAGIAAFVLKYRLPDDSTMKNKSISPLQDAQQALAMVRTRAKEWNVDPKKVGIMGFSAGGHVASTAGTHYDRAYLKGEDGSDIPSSLLRPDFQLLIYPVIDMSDSALMHVGSRDNLLGKHPSTELARLFSNQLQITKSTPPAFLVHAADDKAVPVGNSLRFSDGLRKLGIPTSKFIYEKGGHGFGMKNPTSKEDWFKLALNWMSERGMR
jgi:acetyl esterase/lipase